MLQVQSIIPPSILEGDKSDSLLYGSVDNGEKIYWNESFHSKVCEQYYIFQFCCRWGSWPGIERTYIEYVLPWEVPIIVEIQCLHLVHLLKCPEIDFEASTLIGLLQKINSSSKKVFMKLWNAKLLHILLKMFSLCCYQTCGWESIQYQTSNKQISAWTDATEK